MKELYSQEHAGRWWRISRRTHGIAVGINWPSPNWPQWQISVLVIDLTWGRTPP